MFPYHCKKAFQGVQIKPLEQRQVRMDRPRKRTTAWKNKEALDYI